MMLTSLCRDLFAYTASQPVPSNYFVTLTASAYHTFLILALCTQSVMTSEMFPTSVRNTGMGICIACGRVSEMLTQYLGAGLHDHPAALLYIVSLIMLIGSSIPFLLKQEDMTGSILKDDIDQKPSRRTFSKSVL